MVVIFLCGHPVFVFRICELSLGMSILRVENAFEGKLPSHSPTSRLVTPNLFTTNSELQLIE
jgi:hypothetical protein